MRKQIQKHKKKKTIRWYPPPVPHLLPNINQPPPTYSIPPHIKTTIDKGSGVASQDELDAVENKIPNVSGFLLTSVVCEDITNSKLYDKLCI